MAKQCADTQGHKYFTSLYGRFRDLSKHRRWRTFDDNIRIIDKRRQAYCFGFIAKLCHTLLCGLDAAGCNSAQGESFNSLIQALSDFQSDSAKAAYSYFDHAVVSSVCCVSVSVEVYFAARSLSENQGRREGVRF